MHPSHMKEPGNNTLASIIERQGFVVLDGALATELERHGAQLNDSLWSAKMLYDSPGLIRKVHEDYLRAGADIISTATYQATIQGFMDRDFRRDEAVRLLKLGVELAVQARDAYWEDEAQRSGVHPLVAASVGPYGAYLADGSEYHGNYGLSERELMDFHRPRLEILSQTEADLFAFETIPSLLEGRAITQLLREFPSVSAWLAFSCCDDIHVSHGEKLADCALLAEESEQIVAVGVNCSKPRHIEALVREARGATEKVIVVYPNSGEVWDAETKQWLEGSAESSIASGAIAWNRAGARIIGGCCRTTPHDIVEVRRALSATLLSRTRQTHR